ncbi:hypothetical protein TNCV_3125671 [Trichonephila clavipes]|nr:hypothetical protein TNCV_3125671 [Trichonephila clavipes]
MKIVRCVLVTQRVARWTSNAKVVDNMLIKYQMIKFIDFCEVWFLKSGARVADLFEITAATRLGIDSKRLWMCSWGTADQAASTRCQR